MLKLRDPRNQYTAVWLVEPGVKVGRLSSNHLVIDHPDVAECQFEIRVKGDQLILKNRAPDRALKLNGHQVPDGCVLRENDIIAVGDIELHVVDPKKAARPSGIPKTGWALKGNATALGNRVFPLLPTTLVGRSSDCDISLAAAHLSRRHARLQVLDGLLYVKDLGSANGTYLNGKQVSEARVRRGDELRFDTLSFGVIGPSDDLGKTSVRSLKQVNPTPPSSSGGARPGIKKRTPTMQRSHSPDQSRRLSNEHNPSVNVTGSVRRSNGLVFLWLMFALLVVGGMAYTYFL